MWCIGKITPEYRERMYDILDLYAEPYDGNKPVVCMDEKSKQLLKDSRKPIPMKLGQCQKIDYEYQRCGTSNIFVAIEPKGGKRKTQVTKQRTRTDFAHFIKNLVNETYPQATKIRLVLDNLNTHFEKSFFKTFNQKEAKRILKKIEFHYTPKHASWLNMAEIEIGILDRQCLRKRIGDRESMKNEVAAWEKKRNTQKAKIRWKFTREAADLKLSKHYI